jgi:hypothetical protein
MTANTWYQPLTDPAEIELAAHWVLGREGIFLNSVGDVSMLPNVLDAAERLEARPRRRHAGAGGAALARAAVHQGSPNLIPPRRIRTRLGY